MEILCQVRGALDIAEAKDSFAHYFSELIMANHGTPLWYVVPSVTPKRFRMTMSCDLGIPT
jgi:hypothetical protein